MSQHLLISDFCGPFLMTIEKEATLENVIKMMDESNIRHLPIVENDKPIGIISERDLRIFENREFAKKFTAEDIMIPSPFTVHENTPLLDVVGTMLDKKWGSCLIQDDDGKITGLFTTSDALKILKILIEKTESARTILLNKTSS